MRLLVSGYYTLRREADILMYTDVNIVDATLQASEAAARTSVVGMWLVNGSRMAIPFIVQPRHWRSVPGASILRLFVGAELIQ